eukprot:TRINITY_DN2360_c0_g1_i1.p2 TRINITY_DN2360_c0_g1~~TRINITY_DN2360_c0_g1_i1.p2  ORF type:complete len:264 (-),score=27.55 TRINITY_DN2360_c0_g1_i1:1174-1965(-)
MCPLTNPGVSVPTPHLTPPPNASVTFAPSPCSPAFPGIKAMAVPTKHAEAIGRASPPAVGEPIRPRTGAFHPPPAQRADAELLPPPPPTATTYADLVYAGVYTIPLPVPSCAPSSPISSSEGPASSFTSSSSGSPSGAHNGHRPTPNTAASSALPSSSSVPPVAHGVVVVQADKLPTSPMTPASLPPSPPATGAFVQLTDVYSCPPRGVYQGFCTAVQLGHPPAAPHRGDPLWLPGGDLRQALQVALVHGPSSTLPPTGGASD